MSKVMDVAAYETDETYGRNHWRAIERSVHPTPVSDVVNWNALLVLCGTSEERAAVNGMLAVALAGEAPIPPVAMSREATPRERGLLDAVLLVLEAVERLQERAYGDARGRDIADTVIARRELLKLLPKTEAK